MSEIYLTLPISTQIFIATILTLTFLMAVPFYNERTASIGPTILTMLGIFGCFYGIAVGLQEFKTTDIENSVPELLQGIKTAFWASVAGVFGALLMKVRFLLFGPPKTSNEGSTEGATVDDLARLLQRLNHSLAGKDESTLISQIKLLRQETGDGLEGLKSSIDDFASDMTKNNADALIEALSEVIRDFNTKLSEQFGENFKQLNVAVKDLVVWQDTYRKQVAELIILERTTASNMADASSRYTALVSDAESFAKTASGLSSLMTTLELQRGQIQDSVASLGNLLKEASNGLPKIEAQIGEMTKQIETGVRSSNDQIMATVKTVTTSLQTSHADMKKLLIEAVEKANNDVNAHMRQLADSTKNQVVALDKALSDELTKSITTLGQHLTALSAKFVEDYSPLTDKLQRLVQAAGRV